MSLPVVNDAKKIALYVSNDNEVITSFLIKTFRQENKQVFLPVMAKKTLEFYQYLPHEQLVAAQFGILQPPIMNKEPIEINQIDLICLPLVAFNDDCERLGMGGGFYDHVLSYHSDLINKPWLIGLAYSFQHVDDLPVQSFDVGLNAIVTENMIYCTTKNK